VKTKRFKIIKVVAIITVLINVGLFMFLFLAGPKLPDNTDFVIEEVINSELPEYVKGKSGYIVSSNTNVWYESLTPEDSIRGTVLLFMGISNDALGWPQSFLENLLQEGYQVIRYDYRSTGLSDWVENWEKTPFTLNDLALDATIILDTLKVKKAHLVGISLGGMVAQDFAINFPERTLTLTSMMSSGHITDPELPPMPKSIIFKLVQTSIKYGIPQNEKNTIKQHIAARLILRGEANYEVESKELALQVLYNLRKRKGYNPQASEHHHQATYESGSRYDKLASIKVPVLIIHGIEDPFISIEHSKKLAKLIPNSKTMWVDNLGHDLPKIHYRGIIYKLVVNFNENPF